jgi:hypothetical protein
VATTVKHSSRHIFVVAGYPASGKSTLLAQGAMGRAPVFGEEHDGLFRSVCKASGRDERATTAEKLEAGMWFTLADLNALERLDPLPPNLVFHLDLLLFLLAVIRPRELSEINRRSVGGAFRGLLDRKLFRAFDRIVACTLLPDFDLLRGSWQERIDDGMRIEGALLQLKHEMIVKVPDPRAIYEGICHEWIEAISLKACQHVIRQWQRGGTGAAPGSGDS